MVTLSKEFQTLKNNIINLISNKIEITKETEYKNGGKIIEKRKKIRINFKKWKL